jgi:hypothetical protein
MSTTAHTLLVVKRYKSTDSVTFFMTGGLGTIPYLPNIQVV